MREGRGPPCACGEAAGAASARSPSARSPCRGGGGGLLPLPPLLFGSLPGKARKRAAAGLPTICIELVHVWI